MIGAYMITKGLFFRCDSSYLFGLLSFSSFISGTIVYFYNIKFGIVVYFLFYALCFFILYLIFRQNIHLKTFAIVCFEVVLLSLKEIIQLNNSLFWIIQGTYFFTLVVLFIIYLLRTKERKNGVQHRKKRLQKTRS